MVHPVGVSTYTVQNRGRQEDCKRKLDDIDLDSMEKQHHANINSTEMMAVMKKSHCFGIIFVFLCSSNTATFNVKYLQGGLSLDNTKQKNWNLFEFISN